MSRFLDGKTARTGGIVEALRRSPLVDADLELEQLEAAECPVDL